MDRAVKNTLVTPIGLAMINESGNCKSSKQVLASCHGIRFEGKKTIPRYKQPSIQTAPGRVKSKVRTAKTKGFQPSIQTNSLAELSKGKNGKRLRGFQHPAMPVSLSLSSSSRGRHSTMITLGKQSRHLYTLLIYIRGQT